MDVTGAIRRHPGRAAAAALLGVGVAVAGFLWFRPDRLITDRTVNEAVPGTEAGPGPRSEAGTKPGGQAGVGGPSTVAEGEFVSLEHETEGRAVVLEADGKRYLRFEDFSTSDGPDLVVYLSAKAPAGTDDWYGY